MDEIAITVVNKSGEDTSFLVKRPLIPVDIKALIGTNLARQGLWDVQGKHHIAAVQTRRGALCPDYLIPDNNDYFVITISLYPLLSNEKTPLLLPTI